MGQASGRQRRMIERLLWKQQAMRLVCPRRHGQCESVRVSIRCCPVILILQEAHRSRHVVCEWQSCIVVSHEAFVVCLGFQMVFFLILCRCSHA